MFYGVSEAFIIFLLKTGPWTDLRARNFKKTRPISPLPRIFAAIPAVPNNFRF